MVFSMKGFHVIQWNKQPLNNSNICGMLLQYKEKANHMWED